MQNDEFATPCVFVIRALNFLRHFDFDIRHFSAMLSVLGQNPQ